MPGAALVVRAAARGDYEQWLTLWQGYNVFYGRSGSTSLAEAVTHMTWARFFDVYEPMHALVAERDGELLGLCHYLFHRSTTTIEPICYLQDLFTAPAARGHGVGATLIASCAQAARAAGATRLYWQTHESNHSAQRLYERLAERSGFIVYRKAL
jgi:GNAT superfamily N-acetyltransferase